MPRIHSHDPESPDTVMTVAAAATELGVHPKFFYRRIAANALPAYRLAGSKALRVRRVDVEALKEPANRAAREPADDDIDAEIKRLVDLAPKLSAAQRNTIASLFATVDGGGVGAA